MTKSPTGAEGAVRYLLAIDVGTLSARASLFDQWGNVAASSSSSFELLRPAEHQATYRMDDIWLAVTTAAAFCLGRLPGAASSIIGIAFDATSSLCLEAQGGPPLDDGADVICWMDHRGEAEAVEVDATGHRFLDHVGGAISPEMNLPKPAVAETASARRLVTSDGGARPLRRTRASCDGYRSPFRSAVSHANGPICPTGPSPGARISSRDLASVTSQALGGSVIVRAGSAISMGACCAVPPRRWASRRVSPWQSA